MNKHVYLLGIFNSINGGAFYIGKIKENIKNNPDSILVKFTKILPGRGFNNLENYYGCWSNGCSWKAGL
ncbi:hypothetical protein ACFQU5_02200 [Ureibacillus sp. GCM10028918]